MPKDKESKKKRSPTKQPRKPRGGRVKGDAPVTPTEPTLKSGGGAVRK